MPFKKHNPGCSCCGCPECAAPAPVDLGVGYPAAESPWYLTSGTISPAKTRQRYQLTGDPWATWLLEGNQWGEYLRYRQYFAWASDNEHAYVEMWDEIVVPWPTVIRCYSEIWEVTSGVATRIYDHNYDVGAAMFQFAVETAYDRDENDLVVVVSRDGTGDTRVVTRESLASPASKGDHYGWGFGALTGISPQDLIDDSAFPDGWFDNTYLIEDCQGVPCTVANWRQSVWTAEIEVVDATGGACTSPPPGDPHFLNDTFSLARPEWDYTVAETDGFYTHPNWTACGLKTDEIDNGCNWSHATYGGDYTLTFRLKAELPLNDAGFIELSLWAHDVGIYLCDATRKCIEVARCRKEFSTACWHFDFADLADGLVFDDWEWKLLGDLPDADMPDMTSAEATLTVLT